LRASEQVVLQAGAERAMIQPTDVADPRACEALIDAVVGRFGRIDALINVAGDAQLASIAETSDEQWRRTMAVNLDGPFYLTRAAWPIFTRQEGGVVVNVSSLASIDPFPGFAAYASAKAALNMLTMVTAREGAKIGLSAVAVAPGAVETPLLRSLFNTRQIPASQAMAPEQVAGIVVDCATGRRSFSGGQVIEVRGA
jgi:NAD(P)-dependent dehydrogenase (short-subunit alcohol dehydrogenase family)